MVADAWCHPPFRTVRHLSTIDVMATEPLSVRTGIVKGGVRVDFIAKLFPVQGLLLLVSGWLQVFQV